MTVTVPGGAASRQRLAEHALVEVLLDDLAARRRRLREDVDRADLGRASRRSPRRRPTASSTSTSMNMPSASCRAPLRDLRLGSGRGSPRSPRRRRCPASARRAIFSAAVSSLPSTIVPAWPKLMPGISSMKRPAMKATIGRRESFSRHPVARARPPCGRRARCRSRSPRSARRPRRAASARRRSEPMIASPPIETAVDWPRPAAVSVEDISVVMPPERDITPIGPGRVGLARRPWRGRRCRPS